MISNLNDKISQGDRALSSVPAAIASLLEVIAKGIEVQKKTYSSRIKGIQETANASTRSVMQAAKAEAASSMIELQRVAAEEKVRLVEVHKQQLQSTKDEADSLRATIAELLR